MSSPAPPTPAPASRQSRDDDDNDNDNDGPVHIPPVRYGDDVAKSLIETIRASVIGSSEMVEGPFGARPVVYADYVVDAVALLADEGRKLLPYYRFEPDTGLWKHRDGLAGPPLSLHDVAYGSGSMKYQRRPRLLPDGGLPEYLGRARDLLTELADAPPNPLGRKPPATSSCSAGSPIPTRGDRAPITPLPTG